jgi:hypothetical protein
LRVTLGVERGTVGVDAHSSADCAAYPESSGGEQLLNVFFVLK